jgi:polar amino acid transport system substrate-binding protein
MTVRYLKICIGVAVGALFAAAMVPANAGPALDRIKSQGYIRAAVANEVPYGFIDAEGNAKGIAPEVAMKVLATMGVTEIQWVVAPFGALIPGLKANRFDIVAAEHAILPERCKQVAFSEPNSSFGDGLLVKAGNPKNLHAYEDLKNSPDLKLAVVNGTSHLTTAEAVGIPQEQLVVITNNADAPAAILSGRADAYAAVEETAASLAKGNSALELAQPFKDPVVNGKSGRGYGGFTFQSADTDLVAAFNKGLAAFKQTKEYRDILHSYGVGDQSIDASLAISTKTLCEAQ